MEEEVKSFPLRLHTPPEGATKNPSLTFGSLETALCSLAALGSSFMEVQKALQVSLEAFGTSFLYTC
jgi:hypothetical protein